MYGVNWRYLPWIAGLLIISTPLLAVTTLTLTVTIVAQPACVINGNNVIEVNFGDDIMTTRVDGSYKKMPIAYRVECTNMPNNAMKIQISGNGASWDSGALQTSQANLGVALLRNGNRVPLNSWLNFSYPNTPTLEAVLVKWPGLTLRGGAFSAGATMKVEYQ